MKFHLLKFQALPDLAIVNNYSLKAKGFHMYDHYLLNKPCILNLVLRVKPNSSRQHMSVPRCFEIIVTCKFQ